MYTFSQNKPGINNYSIYMYGLEGRRGMGIITLKSDAMAFY